MFRLFLFSMRSFLVVGPPSVLLPHERPQSLGKSLVVVHPAPTSTKKHDLFVSLVDESVPPPQLGNLERLLQLAVFGFCDARSQCGKFGETIRGGYLLVLESLEL